MEAGCDEVGLSDTTGYGTPNQVRELTRAVWEAVGRDKLNGIHNAVAARAHKITIPLSVSETHSLKNVRRTHEQMLEEVRNIAQLIKDCPTDQRPVFEGGLSTAFGCTLEGTVPQSKVVELAEAL